MINSNIFNTLCNKKRVFMLKTLFLFYTLILVIFSANFIQYEGIHFHVIHATRGSTHINAINESTSSEGHSTIIDET
jgi:hypothetical protein